MSVQNGAVPNEESKTAFTILSIYFPEPGEKIKTLEFLEASSGIVSLVEKFGKVFSPVVTDMNGNIKKLFRKYNENIDLNHNIEDMILREKMEGDIIATDALLWLRRALHFISSFFQYIIMDTESERVAQDLTPFVKNAYSDSLERHHGWLGTQLFNVLARFVPTRKQLLYTLALDKHNKEEQVLRDMRQYHQRMMNCVGRLTQFYIEHQLEN
ncbi:hypothetical protein ABEB36_015007 [Hypothenemus hampei]|uniref:Glycolipid transfer protein domain-containing protein n=1 Tax=Hypothenemus hampei TaxID=57062 RepID=A0ABD1E1J2_HYPHA